MKTKESKESRNIVKVVLLLSALAFGLALVIANPLAFNLCRTTYAWNGTIGCLDDTEGVVQSLAFFSIESIIFSTILLFFREKVFLSWYKFAKIYLPFAIMLVLLSAWSSDGGSWGPGNDFDGEAAAWFTSGLFFVTSLILIIWKSWKLKNESLPSKNQK